MGKVVRVLLFGRLAEAAAWREREIEFAGHLDALRNRLAAETPDIASGEIIIAVNRQIVRGATTLADRDEVAFMPPFSGG